MKTTAKLFIIALLALPTTARAQDCDVQKVFDKIINTKGIEHSDSRTVERNEEDEASKDDIIESTVIHDIRVGRPNFSLFKELEEAFQNGYYPTAPTTIYTCFNPLDGSLHQKYEIKLRNGSSILIGQHKESNYALVVLPDWAAPNFRTVYAAEWWNTDDENIRQGRLIRSYGEKPQAQKFVKLQRSFRSPSDALEWTRQWNLPDSVTIGNMMKQFDNLDFTTMKAEDIDNFIKQVQQLQEAYGNNANPTDLPFDGNTDNWMALAMQRGVSNLSNADWHRFFGLLTEKMMKRENKDSNEDLVVAAGIILDLCKNADQLDADEREVSARRLEDVADHHFHNNEYVYDLLMLGAKKLKK